MALWAAMIFLAGPPGAGKTTLGARVRALLDLVFLDFSPGPGIANSSLDRSNDIQQLKQVIESQQEWAKRWREEHCVAGAASAVLADSVFRYRAQLIANGVSPRSLSGIMSDLDLYGGFLFDYEAKVASSSASYDLGVKKDAYRRNGVQEYVVWRVLDQTIDWFTLQGETFERLVPSAEGVLRSRVFPGLWLDAESLLADRTDRVLDVLQRGLSSAEHAQFVERLQAAGRKG